MIFIKDTIKIRVDSIEQGVYKWNILHFHHFLDKKKRILVLLFFSFFELFICNGVHSKSFTIHRHLVNFSINANTYTHFLFHRINFDARNSSTRPSDEWMSHYSHLCANTHKHNTESTRVRCQFLLYIQTNCARIYLLNAEWRKLNVAQCYMRCVDEITKPTTHILCVNFFSLSQSMLMFQSQI